MNIYIATNNGDIGGGEVMLMNIAKAMYSLGNNVVIIAPRSPHDVIDAAQQEGFSFLELPADNRATYIAQLFWWSLTKRRNALLWCNGLVPSFATSFQKNRIVHFHQIPEGTNKIFSFFARFNSLRNLVPSNFAAQKINKTTPFYNWVQEVSHVSDEISDESKKNRIGFLGRPSDFKGTHLLAEAINNINSASDDRTVHMVIGGESRFVPENERKLLKPALARLGEKLTELGWVSPETYFQKVSVNVVPSNWDEVFGLVSAETMSAKVPLIVSDAGALSEIVGENYPWIFPQSDVESLGNLISDIQRKIEQEPEYITEVVEKSYQRWLDLFSPEAGRKRVQSLLEEIQK